MHILNDIVTFCKISNITIFIHKTTKQNMLTMYFMLAAVGFVCLLNSLCVSRTAVISSAVSSYVTKELKKLITNYEKTN